MSSLMLLSPVRMGKLRQAYSNWRVTRWANNALKEMKTPPLNNFSAREFLSLDPIVRLSPAFGTNKSAMGLNDIARNLFSRAADRSLALNERESCASLLALLFRLNPERTFPLFQSFFGASPKKLDLLKNYGIIALDGNQEFTEEDIGRIMQTFTLMPSPHLLGVRVISKHDTDELVRLEFDYLRKTDAFDRRKQFDALLGKFKEGAADLAELLLSRKSSYVPGSRAIRLHSLHVEKRPVLLHEIGHAVWFCSLSEEERKEFSDKEAWLFLPGERATENDFSERYGMISTEEDWATLYQSWAGDHRGLKARGNNSAVLGYKTNLMASNVFYVTTSEGQKVLKIYPKGIPQEYAPTYFLFHK